MPTKTQCPKMRRSLRRQGRRPQATSRSRARVSCQLTWRFAARRANPQMRRGGCRRVRQHRHVRRRYLWYAASSAMPTKSTTTAKRMTPARRSMALEFTYLIYATLDLAMNKIDAGTEHNGSECCSDKPKGWISARRRGDSPADQGDFGHDHDPEPEPEINQALLEPIELGHSTSNVAAWRGVDSAF